MNKEDIIIKQIPEGGFDIIYGDRSTGLVNYDEMLGAVSALTMPNSRPHLQWFKTEAQHRAFYDRYHMENTKLEDLEKLLPEKI